MTSPSMPELKQVDVGRRAHRLATYGYIALAAGSAGYFFYSPWQDPLVTLMGIALGNLGMIPILRWLQKNDQAYPLAELMQFTMVPFYAVPLLTAHPEVVRYPSSILLQAGGIVLLLQVTCMLGATTVDRTHYKRPQPPWWTDDLVSDDTLRFSGYTFMLTTAWLLLSNFTRIIPPELNGSLRAVFFGIGTISAFIQARMWGNNQLKPQQKGLFVTNMILQFILMNLSLVLVTSMIMLLLVLVGYFSSARRMPWLVCLLALPVFAVLHAGKHKMRDNYWGDQGHDVTFAEVPAFYREWVDYGLASASKHANDEDNPLKRSSLFERASLFQLVCYALDMVPDRTPFFYGDTYALVLPQFIPRFVWPEKPSPNDSVKMLSVRLGVLTAEQAETTSIGYGLITECYVNFDVYGIAVLGFVLGWTLRKVARNTELCGTLSGGGIFRIMCLAWCLNAETTMAVWLSSFYQACIAIFVPILFYRSFLK